MKYNQSLKQSNRDRSLYELTLLIKMLIDYKKATLYTKHGFCYYIKQRFDYNVYNTKTFKQIFPHLYYFGTLNVKDIKGHWFYPGERSSRIKAIKQAINLISSFYPTN